jgi:YD repeat-containing protein
MKGLIGKILLASLLLLPLFSVCAYAQLDAATMAKRQARKNLVIREWNTDAKTQTKWLDRITTYDDQGRKIEEIEYTRYGQKWRETFEYGANGKVAKELVYNERNKLVSIKKIEWNEFDRKKVQYTYDPKGRLVSTKTFEYLAGDG